MVATYGLSCEPDFRLSQITALNCSLPSQGLWTGACEHPALCYIMLINCMIMRSKHDSQKACCFWCQVAHKARVQLKMHQDELLLSTSCMRHRLLVGCTAGCWQGHMLQHHAYHFLSLSSVCQQPTDGCLLDAGVKL